MGGGGERRGPMAELQNLEHLTKIGTAPVQPILVKMGKNLHYAESKSKKENAESPSIFSNLAKILDFWNRA